MLKSLSRAALIAAVATVGLLAGGTPPAAANPGGEILFGIEAAELWAVNPSTGAATLVGPIGFDPVSGLAVDASGSLFSTHDDPGQAGPQLITIDPATGTGTAVSNVNSDLGMISGLAFDSSGTLFGVTFFGDLVTVNPATGAVTPVGSIGLAENAHVTDIAFDTSGVLFGVTFDPGSGPPDDIPGQPPQLTMIDTVTGLATSVGPLDPQLVLAGIAFDSSGALFGVTCDLGLDPQLLITIDPVTAAATVVGSLAAALVCLGNLAFAPDTTAVDVGVAGGGFRTKPRVDLSRCEVKDDSTPGVCDRGVVIKVKNFGEEPTTVDFEVTSDLPGAVPGPQCQGTTAVLAPKATQSISGCVVVYTGTGTYTLTLTTSLTVGTDVDPTNNSDAKTVNLVP